MLKLYLISQDTNNGYDTFDSAVVCAKNEKIAQTIHPFKGLNWDGVKEDYDTWCDAKDVEVVELGKANKNQKEGDVICSSFNAG